MLFTDISWTLLSIIYTSFEWRQPATSDQSELSIVSRDSVSANQKPGRQPATTHHHPRLYKDHSSIQGSPDLD